MGEKSIYRLIFFIFIVALFKNVLTVYPLYLDYKLRYIDDIAVLWLFLLIFKDAFFGKMKKSSMTIIFLTGLFLIIWIVQILILKIDVLKYNYFFFIRDSFWYFPVFYFIYKCRDHDILKKYNALIFKFLKIQFIFVGMQILYSLAADHKMLFMDLVNGSLEVNGSHKLAYALLLTIPSIWKSKSRYFLFGALFIIVLTSARSAILYFAVTIAFYLILISRLSLAKKIVYFAAILGIFGGVYWFYTYRTGTTFRFNYLLNQQKQVLKPGAGARRLSFVMYTVELLKKNGLLWTGGGPGSYASRSSEKMEGYLYKIYKDDFPYHNEYVAGGSSLNVWLGEMGIIGCGLFVLIYMYILLKVIKLNKIYVLGVMPYILGLSAQKLNEAYVPSILFWLVLGIALNKDKRKPDQKLIIHG